MIESKECVKGDPDYCEDIRGKEYEALQVLRLTVEQEAITEPYLA
jgi:hypothetical protein